MEVLVPFVTSQIDPELKKQQVQGPKGVFLSFSEYTDRQEAHILLENITGVLISGQSK